MLTFDQNFNAIKLFCKNIAQGINGYFHKGYINAKPENKNKLLLYVF